MVARGFPELLHSVGEPAFTRGRVGFDTASTTRDICVGALQAADRGDYGLLAEFVLT